MKNMQLLRGVLAVAFAVQAVSASGQYIVGHRGASHDAPENTLAAFRLAWQQGADGVEGDFYLTSDGRVVCIHDRDTERVAGVKWIVAESTFEQLRKLDVGSWKGQQWRGEKIPSLEEVLATAPAGKKVIIELKVGPEIVEPTLKILKTSRFQMEQVLVISFHADTIASCKRRLPHLRTHWLSGYKNEDDGTWKPTTRQVSATLQRTGANGFGSEAVPEYFNESFLGKLRQSGLQEFHVWTVDDPEVAREYQRLGAWGITTNRPGWLRKQLRHVAKP